MPNILLFYDTLEKDLARDFKDLLDELNAGPIIMIPTSPDKGLTLEAKEELYIENAEGAIVLITPGAERLGSFFPSPSVSHEMGQLKQKFKKTPDNVIYLMDKKCISPTIDQKCYISFDRRNIRSILEAITHIIKNLKNSKLYRTNPVPLPENEKRIDCSEIIRELGPQKVDILFHISNLKNGMINDTALDNFLTTEYSFTIQEINLFKKDLSEKHGLLVHKTASEKSMYSGGRPIYINIWFLSNLGWDVIRAEIEAQKKMKNIYSEYLKNPVDSWQFLLNGASNKMKQNNK